MSGFNSDQCDLQIMLIIYTYMYACMLWCDDSQTCRSQHINVMQLDGMSDHADFIQRHLSEKNCSHLFRYCCTHHPVLYEYLHWLFPDYVYLSLCVSQPSGMRAQVPLPSPKLKSSSRDNSGSCHNASYVPLSPYLPGLCSCPCPGEDSLVPFLAKAAEESGAVEITHFNRPVTSVFRTCGGLLLLAYEWSGPKMMWQAVMSSGRGALDQRSRGRD